MRFIGRKKELKIITEAFESQKAELLIIYGRRRLGKSTLLKKAIEKKTDAIYHLLVEESQQQNIRYFAQQLTEITLKKVFSHIQVKTYLEYFLAIRDEITPGQIFIFDEFPYLIKQQKEVLSQFQKIYDEILKPKRCKLILCGSSKSIMSDLQGYSSPLYGRRTRSIELKEFSLKEVQEFFPKRAKKIVLQYYSLFGGVPYYLEQIDDSLTFEENMKVLFFEQKSFFHDEIKFLLKEEVQEIRNYMTIIRAISQGKNTFTEISDFSFIEKSSLAKYLDILKQLDFIEVYASFFDKQNTTKRRYRIKDIFTYFWYSVLESEIPNIESKSKQTQILEIKIPSHFGKVYERFCQKRLTKDFAKVGTYFKKDIEIDIIAQLNATEFYLFECKWNETILEKKEVQRLYEKSTRLPQKNKYLCYIIYPKSNKYGLDWLFV